jgi:hypothetical protein
MVMAVAGPGSWWEQPLAAVQLLLHLLLALLVLCLQLQLLLLLWMWPSQSLLQQLLLWL